MERSVEESLQDLYICYKRNMNLCRMIQVFNGRFKERNFDGLTEGQIIDIQNKPIEEECIVLFINFYAILEDVVTLGTPGTKSVADKMNELDENLRRMEGDFNGFMRGIAGQEYWDSLADDEGLLLAMSRFPEHFTNYK